jgi:hypothetical protein
MSVQPAHWSDRRATHATPPPTMQRCMRLVFLAGSAAAYLPRFPNAVRRGARYHVTMNDDDPPSPLSKAAWFGAEVFGKAAKALQPASAPVASTPVAPPPTSRAEAKTRLLADYERSYFVSGAMDEGLYAEDCLFADDIASFGGPGARARCGARRSVVMYCLYHRYGRFVANLDNLCVASACHYSGVMLAGSSRTSRTSAL